MTIDKKKLQLYLANNCNVLLTGRHGVGKTHVCMEVFNEAGLNWAYFSGSTLDPWVDFCGVPFEKDGKLVLIRPENFEEDKVEAIFIDEYNRSHSKIKNAVMELIQFKTINGRRFNNLKVVWAAVNPADDDSLSYDVEELDPAQEDRFPVQIHVPYEVDVKYFQSKFGDNGEKACQWWNELPDEQKEKVSPRRLDYALQVFGFDGDLRDVLDESTNISRLVSMLNTESISKALARMYEAKDDEKTKMWINSANNYDLSIKSILDSDDYKPYFLPLVEQEQLATLISEDEPTLDWSCKTYFVDDTIRDCVDNVMRFSQGKLRQTLKDRLISSVPATNEWDMVGTIGSDEGEPILPTQFGNGDIDYSKYIELFDTQGVQTKVPAVDEFLSKIPKTMDTETAEEIMKVLDMFYRRSHYKTSLAAKNSLMAIFNHTVQTWFNEDRSNVDSTYYTLFDKYVHLYRGLYFAKFFPLCIR